MPRKMIRKTTTVTTEEYLPDATAEAEEVERDLGEDLDDAEEVEEEIEDDDESDRPRKKAGRRR